MYLGARGQDPGVFASSQEHLNQTGGAVNTLLLLTSSLCVAAAVKAARRGRGEVARSLLGGAIGGGVAFGVVKVLEYRELLGDDLTPATNDFFMYYFVLTWLHLLHLIVGMVILAFVRVTVRRGELTGRQIGFVEGGGCYWHMVDVIWIVLFPLLYLLH